MISYLIFGEGFSGVIASQAVDTCKFLSQEFNVRLKLVVFLPLANYQKHRLQYKNSYPSTLTIPMFFGSKRWRLYIPILWLIALLLKRDRFICRGVRATQLALRASSIKKVVYDGRGAHAAEYREYFSVLYQLDKDAIQQEWLAEKEAVLGADYRIAVSNKLVEYWQSEFQYEDDKHVVIPCTLSGNFVHNLPTTEEILQQRKKLGYSVDDVIVIFSGSVAGWQSFRLIDDFLMQLLSNQEDVKVLFLSRIDLQQFQAFEQFPQRIQKTWLPTTDVFATLAIGDYGLLLRESSITNQVAAPVKFAEYLAAGLKIIMTKQIGDYSEKVTSYDLGLLINIKKVDGLIFNKVKYKEKQYLNKFSITLLIKRNFIEQYLKILNSL